MWVWIHSEHEHFGTVLEASFWQAANISATSVLQYLVLNFLWCIWMTVEQLDWNCILWGIWGMSTSAFSGWTRSRLWNWTFWSFPPMGFGSCDGASLSTQMGWLLGEIKLWPRSTHNMLQQLADVQSTLQMTGNKSPWTVYSVDIRSQHTDFVLLSPFYCIALVFNRDIPLVCSLTHLALKITNKQKTWLWEFVLVSHVPSGINFCSLTKWLVYFMWETGWDRWRPANIL